MPDLILLDLNLPGMDGIALLKQIRTQPEFASLPVVFWTGSADSQTVDRLRHSGAEQVLEKPTTSTRFHDTVAALVELLTARQ